MGFRLTHLLEEQLRLAMPGQESHISGERFTSRQHCGRAAGLAAPSHLATAGASAAEQLSGWGLHGRVASGCPGAGVPLAQCYVKRNSQNE